MRMAELSRESGVSTATIKYYLREGLLPAGEHTGPNQARYDETHLRRLRLIRTLLDIAGLSIAGVREVVEAMDDPELPPHRVLGTAQRAITPPAAPAPDRDRAWAMELITTVAERRGWRLPDGGPILDQLVTTLIALRDTHQSGILARLPRYAAAADRLAAVDIAALSDAPSIEEQIEMATAGLLLSDTLVAGLRRLAQKSAVLPEQTPDPR